MTFDGSNCSAVNQLGAQIFSKDYKEIKNYFSCPSEDDKNIKIILDACHMAKLGRNALADYKIFKTDKGFIKWDFIKTF